MCMIPVSNIKCVEQKRNLDHFSGCEVYMRSLFLTHPLERNMPSYSKSTSNFYFLVLFLIASLAGNTQILDRVYFINEDNCIYAFKDGTSDYHEIVNVEIDGREGFDYLVNIWRAGDEWLIRSRYAGNSVFDINC